MILCGAIPRALQHTVIRIAAMLREDTVGVADLVGAASVLVTEEALAELTRRAKGEKAEEAAE